MKKKFRILCLAMVILLTGTLLSAVNTSAAELLKNTVDFELEATFNSITITPPEKSGHYIYYCVYEEDAGMDMELYVESCSKGDLSFADFDCSLLFTEEVTEYYAFTGTYDTDGFEVYNPIKSNSNYYVLLFELDLTGYTADVIAFGGKWISTPETPDIYKGYEGYLQNTIDFEVIPGDSSITLEPMGDGKTYAAEIVEGVDLATMEETLGYFASGTLTLDEIDIIDEEHAVSGIMDVDGNIQQLTPDTTYVVLYYLLDSDTLPANIVTYGAKEVKTLKNLDKYENSSTVVILTNGDANQDAEINVKDATAIQKHSAKTEKITDKYGLLCADVNGDGNINVKDATAIQKYIAKVDSGCDVGLRAPFKK